MRLLLAALCGFFVGLCFAQSAQAVTHWRFSGSGLASWYDERGTMANGQQFDPRKHICAMLTEPLGTRIMVLNEASHNASYCTVTDRGPYIQGRIVDVSPAVRDELGFGSAGVIPVRIYAVTR